MPSQPIHDPLLTRGVISLPDLPNAVEPSEQDLRVYATYRAYVQHEDDLTNNRLNWNFTIQGFLFAAYSFSLQKIAEVRADMLNSKAAPSPFCSACCRVSVTCKP